ncbi:MULTISPECIES: PAS domain-containing protein [unclassified Dinoroseobacter]|uniref:PAS domain-containing protein n=1 Tax=unclassified Dinoroseobacter TaxID=2620028 RepID=UPI003C79D344
MKPRTLGTVLDDREALAGFSRARVAMVLTNPNIHDNPIVYVNDAFERVTGYSRTAAIGRNCRFLQGSMTDEADVAKLRRAIEREEDVTVDILNYRASGEPFLNRLIIAPVKSEDGHCHYFIGIQKAMSDRDIDSSTLSIEKQLNAVQRRVRQDLSMLIDIIRDQSNKMGSEEGFAALARRIECLQLLYEEMRLADRDAYKEGISMGSFLTRVANAIAHSDGRPGVAFSIDVGRFEASLETATRTGLIVSEVLTNAFQHAFIGLDAGTVRMEVIALTEGGFRVVVSDDGVGIPSDLPIPSTQTLGGRIATELIDSLEGTLTYVRGAAGTVVIIDVPAGA